LKLNFILIGVVLSIFANTSISNAETKNKSKCEADEVVEACKKQIPTAEANAKIKLLFGYPSNRYIATHQSSREYCKNLNRCVDYLSTLKTIESEYQACQYAKKVIPKDQKKKVWSHMSSIGVFPPGKLDPTHLRNRQSDEGRWLVCNYIVACEHGVTFLGQETDSLCQ
jgi:hypothetical protein